MGGARHGVTGGWCVPKREGHWEPVLKELDLKEPAASSTKHPRVHRDRKGISGFQGLGAEGSGCKVSVWG